MISSPASRRILLSYLIALAPALIYFNMFNVPPQDDAGAYWRLGKQWAVTGIYGTPGHPEGYWPVGYPAFVSSIVTMFGDDPRFVLTGNLVLYALMIALAGRIGFLAYGEKVAMGTMLLTGTIYDVFTLPSLILSENAFMPLFLGAIVLVMETERPHRMARWGAAGFLFGAACLTRGVLLALPPFLLAAVALWFWWPRQRRQKIMLHLAVLTAAMCIPVGFWTQRNYQQFGIFVPVSLNAGEVFALGNNKFNTYWFLDSNDKRRRGMGLYGTDVAKHQRGMMTAMEEITGNPVGFVVKSFIRCYWTFSGESPWWANRTILEEPPVGLGVNVVYLETVLMWQWLIFMLMTLAGLWHGRHTGSPKQLLLLGLCAYWVLFHSTATHIHPRYRLPIVPIFAVYAAFYLINVRKHRARWRDEVMAEVPEPQ